MQEIVGKFKEAGPAMSTPIHRSASSSDEVIKTLVFRLPRWSRLGMREAKERVLSVLRGLPGVSIKRVAVAHQAKEISVEADFPLRGYQFIRNRFKTDLNVGAPLLTIRHTNATKGGDGSGKRGLAQRHNWEKAVAALQGTEFFDESE